MISGSRSISLRYLMFFGVCSVTSALYAQTYDSGAVVRIFSVTADSKGGVGTGSLISADGQILTCYHVVQNAHTIKIFFKGEPFTDVTVVSVSPQYDLALLKVKGLPDNAPFLKVRQDSPKAFSSGPAATTAYPGDLSDKQQLPVSVTSDTWIPSGHFRNADEARLFNKTDVDLITISATIYNGMSGAPLITQNGIEGVISGSYNEGGSIAWAIPTKYLNSMTAVGKPPGQISTWEPLELMSPFWRTLRKEVSLSAGLAQALDHYTDTVSELHQILLIASPMVKPWGEAWKAFQDRLDVDIAMHGAGYEISNNFALRFSLATQIRKIQGAENAAVDAAQPQADDAVDIGDYDDLIDDLPKAAASLETELQQYLDNLPRTPRNGLIKGLAKSRMAMLSIHAREQGKLRIPDDEDSEPEIENGMTLGDLRDQVALWATTYQTLGDPDLLAKQFDNTNGLNQIVEAVIDGGAKSN